MKFQSKRVKNYAVQGLKILSQRGYKLSAEGIENCIDRLKDKSEKDLANDLSIILINTSRDQIISKKAFDQLFDLVSSHHYIQDNLINIIE